MIIGFTGTQKGLTQAQRYILRNLLATLHPTEAHHGDCVGADAAFHGMLVHTNCRIIVHPSNIKDKRAYCSGAFKVLPPKPPLARNPDIYAKASLLIACPKNEFEEGRSGTWTTARGAHGSNVSVTVVWPDGRVQPNWEPEK